MTCIDFNLIMYDNGPEQFTGANHEQRSNCYLTDHGLLSPTVFQVTRQSLPRRSSRQDFYLSRSVLLHEFCSTYRSREFTRHRSMSSSRRSKTISCRHESPRVSNHFGQSQRATRLQDLSRHRFDFDRPGSPIVCPSFLCCSRQKQSGFYTSGFISGGQKPRFAKRLSHSINRPEKLRILSRTVAADSLCRCRTEQTVPDQQLQSVTLDDCTAVQVSPADRTVFQMDQAAPSDQSLLWHHTQCCQDTGVGRYQRLCAGRYYEKATRLTKQYVRNSTGFGHYAFRENTRKKSVSCGFQQLFKEQYI